MEQGNVLETTRSVENRAYIQEKAVSVRMEENQSMSSKPFLLQDGVRMTTRTLDKAERGELLVGNNGMLHWG